MVEEKGGEELGKALLKKNTFQKIDYLLNKRVIKEKDVYYLLRDFLKKYADVNYQFTHQEIIDELKNVYIPGNIRNDFFDFIDGIFVFEYVKRDYSEKELRSFLEEFRDYLEHLIVIHEKKKTFFDKVGDFFEKRTREKKKEAVKETREEGKKEEEKAEEPIFVPGEKLPIIEKEDEFYVKFKTFLEQMYYSLDNNDVETAKHHYSDIMSLYNTLTSEDKHMYYEELMEAYRKLISSL